MDFETFRKAIKKEKTEKPILFELEHDDIPTMKDVIAFHKQYQIFYQRSTYRFFWILEVAILDMQTSIP